MQAHQSLEERSELVVLEVEQAHRLSHRPGSPVEIPDELVKAGQGIEGRQPLLGIAGLGQAFQRGDRLLGASRLDEQGHDLAPQPMILRPGRQEPVPDLGRLFQLTALLQERGLSQPDGHRLLGSIRGQHLRQPAIERQRLCRAPLLVIDLGRSPQRVEVIFLEIEHLAVGLAGGIELLGFPQQVTVEGQGNDRTGLLARPLEVIEKQVSLVVLLVELPEKVEDAPVFRILLQQLEVVVRQPGVRLRPGRNGLGSLGFRFRRRGIRGRGSLLSLVLRPETEGRSHQPRPT